MCVLSSLPLFFFMSLIGNTLVSPAAIGTAAVHHVCEKKIISPYYIYFGSVANSVQCFVNHTKCTHHTELPSQFVIQCVNFDYLGWQYSRVRYVTEKKSKTKFLNPENRKKYLFNRRHLRTKDYLN